MLNWRELPFVRLLAAFIAGILLSIYFNKNNSLLLALPWVVLPILWLSQKIRGWYKYRWLFGSLGYVFLFLLGYHVGYFHDDRNSQLYYGKYISENENVLIGAVNDAPIKKGKWVRLKLNIEGLGRDAGNIDERNGNLLLYVSRDSASEEIKYGDLLFFKNTPTEVGPPKNPHSFDFRKYLHFQNIHYQAFVRGGEWKILEHGHGNIFFSTAIALQERFLEILKKHLPSEKEFAVGSALILGYRDEIPEEVQTAYSQTGAMHVLAVSGLHVGIVFIILNFFLIKIKSSSPAWRVSKVLIILLAIWAFALITGSSPSVTRAAVMFSFLNIGLAFRQYMSIYNTLASSAFFILLFNPYLIASVGFQLSYLAVFGIVYFQPKIARLWKVNNKIGNYMWQLACVSLAAQITTLPLTFYYFNQLPVYFWLTGLILVPLAGFELGAGIFLLLFEMVFPPLAIVFGKILYLLLWFGNWCVFMIQQLPAAVVEGIWISGAVSLLLYLMIANVMVAISSRKYKWLISGLCFLLAVGINYAFSEIKNQQGRQLTVYNIYKNTAIDFFDGNKVYSLTNKGIGKKPLGFATEGHRYAMGMDELIEIKLDSDTSFISGRFYFQNNFVQFYDIKMAIVDGSHWLPENTRFKVDYILVRNSPKMVMDELASSFDFKKIIFDVSNKKWQLEKWKKQCGELGLEYYDIGEEGAFVLDLPK